MADQAANDNNNNNNAQEPQMLTAQSRPSMTLDAAFNNIVQVVRAYRGTADEHDALRLSLQVLWEASHPVPVVPKEPVASPAPTN